MNKQVDLISRADVKAKKIYSHERHEYVVPVAEIDWLPSVTPQLSSPLEKNSKKLEKDFGELDCISRQAVLDLIADYDLSMGQLVRGIHALPSVTPQEPNTGHCKDCKWWKDSDGEYRRGVNAESQCPINRKEVYEGNGYCFLYEPQESEK